MDIVMTKKNVALLLSNTATPDLTGYKAVSDTQELYDDNSTINIYPDEYDFFINEEGERHYPYTTTKDMMLAYKMLDDYKYGTQVENKEELSIVFLKERFEELPSCKYVAMWPVDIDGDVFKMRFDSKISHYAAFYWDGMRRPSDGSDETWRDAIKEAKYVAIVAE